MIPNKYLKAYGQWVGMGKGDGFSILVFDAMFNDGNFFIIVCNPGSVSLCVPHGETCPIERNVITGGEVVISNFDFYKTKDLCEESLMPFRTEWCWYWRQL